MRSLADEFIYNPRFTCCRLSTEWDASAITYALNGEHVCERITMGERPFTALFPKEPQIGDEVIIKGRLKPDARLFSINFVLPFPAQVHNGCTCESVTSEEDVDHQCTCTHHPAKARGSSPYIAYHFKTVFHDDGSSYVAQNWKNIVWQPEERSANFWLDDRNDRFTLIFRFHYETIKVFVEDTHHTPDYEFEYQMPIDRIRTVELWNDVELVEELTFRFANIIDDDTWNK
ncbi:uncharacterized protein LOC129776582 [Toxorhynchites rutilus septentrionalis]|uniref:uncharacterized protein LOC129776582 n=1 Tax=Toxorhynchites rutilus septentrionalis TaxID=329112 RepID=UPI00247851C4|nr:uncharacterized protein LOC129776582 [Toxorhynchites rutilus septentrionalis]